MAVRVGPVGTSRPGWYVGTVRTATSVEALGKLTSYGVLVAALAYLAVFGAITLQRLGYPFELEWMEGGSLIEMRRILAGLPLYTAPHLDYVPFIYPPLYFYVAAAVAQVAGPGFLALRLVSLLASLGTFGVIYALVRRETGSMWSGLVSAGLYAATYSHVAGWFDIGRVDALHLFLLMAAVYVLSRSTSTAGAGIAGCLVVLAFLTKQTALVAAAPLAVYCAAAGWRPLLAYVGSAGVFAAASFFGCTQIRRAGGPTTFLCCLPTIVSSERCS